MRTTTKAERLIQDLAARAAFIAYQKHLVNRPPGWLIQSLSAYEREILKELTSEDVRDVRINGLL